jgi:hypothetical protein
VLPGARTVFDIPSSRGAWLAGLIAIAAAMIRRWRGALVAVALALRGTSLDSPVSNGRCPGRVCRRLSSRPRSGSATIDLLHFVVAIFKRLPIVTPASSTRQ